LWAFSPSSPVNGHHAQKSLDYWLFRANLLQSLSAGSLSSSQAAALVNSLNFWMVSSAIWVLAIGAIVLAFDIRRILRLR
jgi:hypothetical protein